MFLIVTGVVSAAAGANVSLGNVIVYSRIQLRKKERENKTCRKKVIFAQLMYTQSAKQHSEQFM